MTQNALTSPTSPNPARARLAVPGDTSPPAPLSFGGGGKGEVDSGTAGRTSPNRGGARLVPWAWCAVAVATVLGVACGNDAQPPSETPRGVPLVGVPDNFGFFEVEHPDGARYRCLNYWEKLGYAGGPTMWCERLGQA